MSQLSTLRQIHDTSHGAYFPGPCPECAEYLSRHPELAAPPALPNRPTPESFDNLTSAELRDLPVAMLGDLQRQFAADQALLDKRKAMLWDALNERFAPEAQSRRHARAQDTGTIHILVDGCDVECKTSKNVKWDNAKLLAALEQLTEDEQKAYLSFSLSVAEEKFQHAPPRIKALLEPARTMKPSKEIFIVTEQK